MEKIKKIALKLIKEIEAGDGVTFIQILEKIKKKVSINDKKLKGVLKVLEKEGLIEERHFKDGRIDYKLEPKGWELIEKI